jgi:uncharacterized membrane protein YfcA
VIPLIDSRPRFAKGRKPSPRLLWRAARFPPDISVPDLPSAATFSALFSDPRFPAALGIAGLAGLVRGFSGFGSALIYVPLMSAVYGPKIAAATFVIGDIITGAVFLTGVWRKAHYREVLIMAACALGAAQLGTFILQHADPVALRWGLSIVVGLVVAILASGWRYHGRPHLGITIGVGILAGLLGGALQISGPPIILYWLGSGFPAEVLRANFFAYFSLFSAGTLITYAAHGLVTAFVLALAPFTTVMTIIGMWAGSRLFLLASERTYRMTGYVICAISAIVAMPLLDPIFQR